MAPLSPRPPWRVRSAAWQQPPGPPVVPRVAFAGASACCILLAPVPRSSIAPRVRRSLLVRAVISFVLILVYVVFWIRWMLRALKDHGQLPYSHYRHALPCWHGLA